MVDSLPRQVLSPENHRSLKSLQRAMVLSSGRRFSLILAHCNYTHLQTQIIERLDQDAALTIRKITIASTSHTLYSAIKSELADDIPQALSITGLEKTQNLEALLSAANQVRDAFRKKFICPLVLWVTDDVLTQMVRLAPDFYSWSTSPISFQLTPSELQPFLREQTDQLFAKLLNPPSNISLDELLQTTERALSPREVKAAQQDLQNQQTPLAPDLVASLQFILGQENYGRRKYKVAIERYQASLQFWQANNSSGQELERQSFLLLCLGYSYLAWGTSESAANESYLLAADQYFQDCFSIFEIANRLDLKAKFISYRGDALKSLKRWDDLQTLLKEAQSLHKSYPDAVEQARVSGLLTEIALQHNHDYTDAIQHGEHALQLLTTQPAQKLMRGRYSLLLAGALRESKQSQSAINVLCQARDHFNPKDNTHRYVRQDPHLYIQILEELRDLYFDQKQYSEAFYCKRIQLVIESQYGLRAFIGAGRLRPNRQTNVSTSPLGSIAEEIATSGRQRDVEHLKERIFRNDYALTILHGQLGVGKSSLIQAGLIPTLEGKPINARDALIVLLRTYLNWEEKLKEKLKSQLEKLPYKVFDLSLNQSDPLQQLQQNIDHNLHTVIIFDQFEEFFVNHPKSSERKPFFHFLSRCLELPFVEIILSLRQDYLHHLLEWERYNDLDCIDANVLNKHHRYELTNFSIKNAQAVIQGLAKRFHLSLEPELVECLVQDLAEDSEQIRPIELQVVGAQLQEEKIRTLKHYRSLDENPKEILVQNYLEGVIRDCGPENKQTAELILFVLTGENNTRPSKTREELETDLRALERDLLPEAKRLDLILEIFQESGLVFLLPENPADRYQLVHDYLVEFIRKQQPRIDKLVKELEEKKVELKITQLEKENAETQQKIAEETQKRTEAELLLEKARKNKMKIFSSFVFSSAIIVCSLSFASYKVLDNNKDKYLTKLVANIYGDIVETRRSYAEKLLVDRRFNEALFEIISASFYLRSRYDPTNEIFTVENSEYTVKESILFFQRLLLEIVDLETSLTDSQKKEIMKNPQNITTEDSYHLLGNLMEVGCTHAKRVDVNFLELEYACRK